MFKRKPKPADITQEEWDDVRADIRGLKKLYVFEEQKTIAQNRAFANAIDELEKRIDALAPELA